MRAEQDNAVETALRELHELEAQRQRDEKRRRLAELARARAEAEAEAEAAEARRREVAQREAETARLRAEALELERYRLTAEVEAKARALVDLDLAVNEAVARVSRRRLAASGILAALSGLALTAGVVHVRTASAREETRRQAYTAACGERVRAAREAIRETTMEVEAGDRRLAALEAQVRQMKAGEQRTRVEATIAAERRRRRPLRSDASARPLPRTIAVEDTNDPLNGLEVRGDAPPRPTRPGRP